MKTRARLCWWCNTRLSKVSHAVVEDRLVHKLCEKEARASFRAITASDNNVVDRIVAAGTSRRDLAHDLIDAAEEDGYDGP